MVAFGLRDRAHAVRELERLTEVVEAERASQAWDSVELEELPVRNMRAKLSELVVGDRRSVPSTGDALLVGQALHDQCLCIPPAGIEVTYE